MSDFRFQVQELQKSEEANLKCIDCNEPDPLWASVSFGIFFCLRCSGVHRSLGVHNSFVRSIKMDKWKELEYKKMKIGGNAKCLEYFKDIKHFSIEEKYCSEIAAKYRELISSLSEEREYDASNVKVYPFPYIPKLVPPPVPKEDSVVEVIGQAASNISASIGKSFDWTRKSVFNLFDQEKPPSPIVIQKDNKEFSHEDISKLYELDS